MRRSPLPPRTTELASVTQLRPGQPLPRRQGLRSVGFTVTIHDGGAERVTPLKPQPKATGFPAAVKLAARARAGGGDPEVACCEACGLWLGRYRGEIQHRAARGMGGSSLGVINSIVNAAVLCGSGALRTGCHGLCEDRDRDMQARGFWLESGQDPVTEPIALASGHGSGVTVYLLLDGTYGYPEPGGDDAA